MIKAADASIEAPRRVFVSFGKRPPRGVMWASGVTDYHARGKRFSRMLGAELDAKPARLDELREQLRAYLGGRRADEDWGYYRGRRLACPYRCHLAGKLCPVDVLVEEINKPSDWLSLVQHAMRAR